jgi:hypothetical protein
MRFKLLLKIAKNQFNVNRVYCQKFTQRHKEREDHKEEEEGVFVFLLFVLP